jgi:hypothetical protein
MNSQSVKTAGATLELSMSGTTEATALGLAVSPWKPGRSAGLSGSHHWSFNFSENLEDLCGCLPLPSLHRYLVRDLNPELRGIIIGSQLETTDSLLTGLSSKGLYYFRLLENSQNSRKDERTQSRLSFQGNA